MLYGREIDQKDKIEHIFTNSLIAYGQATNWTTDSKL